MRTGRFAGIISRNRTLLSRGSLRITRLGSSGDDIVVTNRILTLPNSVTLLRAAFVAVSVWLIAATGHCLLAFLCLWLAAVLDSADGYLARRLNQVSRVGALLDPAIDRLAMAAIAGTLAFTHFIPVWLFAVLAFRDLAVTSIAVVLACQRRLMSVSLTGKLGTMILFLALPLFLLNRNPPGGSPWLFGITMALTTPGLVLYYFSLLQYARTVCAVSAKD